jgi:protein tyrosine phosphatase (PTP) superfamily phosphohydrolase (DUF442 family)
MNRSYFVRLVWASALIFIFCYSPACSSNNERITATPATGISQSRLESPDTNQASRDWAAEINLPGVPNLHKVSVDLYRGAQPSKEGFKELEKLGIKTVINLRAFHSDRDKIKGTKLNYEHINMTAWHPENEDVMRFLRIVTDANLTPIFVHCQHGADRTGTMCAIYRVAMQGWSKDEAIEEMTKGGFGFHSVFKNLPDYINRLDIDKIKQQAGINHQ